MIHTVLLHREYSLPKEIITHLGSEGDDGHENVPQFRECVIFDALCRCGHGLCEVGRGLLYSDVGRLEFLIWFASCVSSFQQRQTMSHLLLISLPE